MNHEVKEYICYNCSNIMQCDKAKYRREEFKVDKNKEPKDQCEGYTPYRFLKQNGDQKHAIKKTHNSHR